MTPAATAAEYNANLGPDFTLADAYDAEYVDDYRPVDVDEVSTRDGEYTPRTTEGVNRR